MSEQQKGIWYSIAAYAAWGVLPIYWKWLQTIPAGEILAHRIFWSFLFVMILLLVSKKLGDVKAAFRNRKQIMVVFFSGFLVSANWFVYIWAVNHEHVVEASLGYYINPLLVFLLGTVVLKERLSRAQAVSIVLAGIGVAVLTFEYGRVPWIAFALAITFALYGLVKKLAKLDSMVALGLETMMVAPIASGYLLFIQWNGSSSMADMSWTLIFLLMGAGIVTAMPLYWFAQGAKKVPFTTLGFIQYLSPSISLVIGVFLYHEPFTSAHLASFSFIWGALFVYSLSHTKWMHQVQHRYGKRAP